MRFVGCSILAVIVMHLIFFYSLIDEAVRSRLEFLELSSRSRNNFITFLGTHIAVKLVHTHQPITLTQPKCQQIPWATIYLQIT